MQVDKKDEVPLVAIMDLTFLKAPIMLDSRRKKLILPTNGIDLKGVTSVLSSKKEENFKNLTTGLDVPN